MQIYYYLRNRMNRSGLNTEITGIVNRRMFNIFIQNKIKKTATKLSTFELLEFLYWKFLSYLMVKKKIAFKKAKDYYWNKIPEIWKEAVI